MSTLTSRLNLSFTDVYECMAMLGRMGSELRDKVSSNQANWADILTLCLIPALLLALIIMIWLVKRGLNREITSLHHNIIGEYNKVLKELESQSGKREIKVKERNKTSKTRLEEEAISAV